MIILGATPIGNLGDASRRLIETMGTVGIIASEDTPTPSSINAPNANYHPPRK